MTVGTWAFACSAMLEGSVVTRRTDPSMQYCVSNGYMMARSRRPISQQDGYWKPGHVTITRTMLDATDWVVLDNPVLDLAVCGPLTEPVAPPF